MKYVLLLCALLSLIVPSFAALSITDVALSEDNAVDRSNPREDGSRTALDDSAELKYVTFSFPVSATASESITAITVTNGFTYSSFGGSITSAALLKLPTLPLTIPAGSQTVSVQVLVPANLDAIDSSFTRVSHPVTVTFTTSDGVKTATGSFYATNNLELDSLTVNADAESYDCDVEDNFQLDCDDDLDELPLIDSLEVEIEVENTFDTDADLDFTDVDLTIDSDNRDIDPSDDSFSEDIDADDLTTLTIDFDVDADVEDGDDATITIEADVEDDNGARHGFTYDFDVSFETKDYDVAVSDIALAPASVCQGESAKVSFMVTNKGAKDQNNVRAVIESPDLGTRQVLSSFAVEREGDRNDQVSKSATLTTTRATRAGSYPIQVTVFYRDEDGDDATEFSTLNLAVRDCTQSVIDQPQVPVQNTTVPQDGSLVVVTPVTPTQPVVQAVKSSDDSSVMLLGVSAAILVLLIVGLVVVLLKR